MKQVLQHARTGEITVEDVPAPQLLPGCVLVRIAASVVSAGTERASAEFARKSLLQKAQARPDLVREVIGKVQRDGILSAIQAVRSRLDQPQSPGYSSAGSVIAVGGGVTDIQPGDRVACAGAGLAVHAEIACIPRLLVARIPGRDVLETGQVAFEEAAFATLGAVALHGVRTSEVKLGDCVAVIGLGLLGQLTVQLLKAAGCRVLGMDIDPSRSDLARQIGADGAASSASAFRDLCLEVSRGAGVDSVLVTAETPSSDPVNLAGAIARDRAIVVAVGTVGMDIERPNYYAKELDFRISRSYGPGRYDSAYEQKGRDYPIGYVRWTETRNMQAFVQLLAEGKMNLPPLITHRFPIDRAPSAYELISGKTREPFLGVVIQYAGTGDDSRTLALVPQSSVAQASRPRPTGIAVGLLGAGGFATSTLIPAMKASSNTVLVSVCAATGSHAQHAARNFGFRSCSTDEAEVIHNPEINTVVVATRHHLHTKQVLAALGAGKNVFCEKPLCLSEDELRAICRAYFSATERPALTVGFNRRFAPMTKQMRSFLAPVSEPLVLHYRINAGYLPPDHWVNDREQGGGRILGEVCHFVDLLMFLAASPIVGVEARAIGGSARYSGDNALISLHFANGSEGTISYLANGDRAFSKERIEVFGGGSTAVLDDFRRLELVRAGRKQTIRSRWRQDKGHRAEWAAFTESLQRGPEPAIRFDDILCSTLATLRIDESLATGKPQVVDTAAFIEAVQTSDLGSSLKE
ncbi:MAG TPA: bi-domain-containing oxidoreductase [Candidatus Dormibacteraeota bacterium]|nr:bi-domain-containing oxidoreductase [Candidatus Dormibacteraeota bacterium]